MGDGSVDGSGDGMGDDWMMEGKSWVMQSGKREYGAQPAGHSMCVAGYLVIVTGEVDDGRDGKRREGERGGEA